MGLQLRCPSDATIIYNRFLQHIEANNILTTEQFGFRSGASTEKASYRLADQILKELNNKMMVGVFFVICVRPLTVLITTFY
jgi:hypothetical protein